VNVREGWRGHLWQERFASFVLDEPHLWAAVRYIERNPVRAGIVRRAEAYRWSSARAHALGRPDPLLHPARPFPGPIDNWAEWLREDELPARTAFLRRCTRTGRPCGSPEFVARLAALLRRPLAPRRCGRKPEGRQAEPGQMDWLMAEQ
jgi:putative transposase